MKRNKYHWQDLRYLREAFLSCSMNSMEPLSKRHASREARDAARYCGCIFHLSEIESMRVIASHEMINSYVANEYESEKSLQDAKEDTSRFEAMRNEI